MKKSFLNILAASVFFTGCLKDTANTDFSNVGTLAEISSSSLNGTPNAPSSGLDYFKQATIPAFTSDDMVTITFNVNIASEFPPNKDVTVTVDVDDNLRTTYNAGPKTQSGGVAFDAMPDSVYNFATKTATIKAGSRLATFTITVDPTKYDVSHSYMLPIKITDASGIKISSNLGSIYIHNLGNKIAGAYTEVGTRYNYIGSSGWIGSGPYPGGYSPADLAGTKIGAPVNTTKITLDYANLGSSGYQYSINWNGVEGAGAAIDVSGNFSDAVIGLTFWTATIDWNGGKPIIHIVTTYTNGSGNDRIIDETFKHN